MIVYNDLSRCRGSQNLLPPEIAALGGGSSPLPRSGPVCLYTKWLLLMIIDSSKFHIDIRIASDL